MMDEAKRSNLVASQKIASFVKLFFLVILPLQLLIPDYVLHSSSLLISMILPVKSVLSKHLHFVAGILLNIILIQFTIPNIPLLFMGSYLNFLILLQQVVPTEIIINCIALCSILSFIRYYVNTLLLMMICVLIAMSTLKSNEQFLIVIDLIIKSMNELIESKSQSSHFSNAFNNKWNIIQYFWCYY